MARELSCHLRHAEWNSWLLVVCLCLLMGWVFGPASVLAGGRIVEQDSDNDGKMDRIAHLDLSGNLVQLEADTNGDEIMDTFQYYEKGVVVRLERDTDGDGRIDEREIMEKGKRDVRQKVNAAGKIVDILNFDDRDRPLEWQRDTTGDGRMDTVYQYEAGKLQLVTRDTTGDGRVNVCQRFQDDVPREQKSDLDGGGLIEQIVEYDAQGRPAKSCHGLDGDGKTETVRIYNKGELCIQKQDTDGNGKPDVVTEFVGGQAFLENREVSLNELLKSLQAMIGSAQDRLVVIKADRTVVLNQVVAVMDVAKAAGAGRLCLATEKGF